jgi:hypothetical protein
VSVCFLIQLRRLWSQLVRVFGSKQISLDRNCSATLESGDFYLVVRVSLFPVLYED